MSVKTNAMRFLETHRCPYRVVTYDNPDGTLDVVQVADCLGIAYRQVFKTLVTVGRSKQYYVFVVPAGYQLDLKKAAQACGEKSVEMVPAKQLLSVVGYQHGACSPLGMKKNFPTFIDCSAQMLTEMYLSAGKRGVSVCVNPQALCVVISAQFADISVPDPNNQCNG